MEISIMNRSAAIKYAHEEHMAKSIVVSINNLTDYPPHIFPTSGNKIVSVLTLFFDDVDSGVTAISSADAQGIAKFVHTYQNTVDRIIVHCEAGQSRSAGVAAAIMKFLFGEDSMIFDNPKYHPNMLCYRRTLEALMKKSLI